MHEFEGVKYTHDMRCPVCRTLLARKFTFSFAFYPNGERVASDSLGGLSYDEMEATYQINCVDRTCGGHLQFDTPGSADQYVISADSRAIGPPIIKLT